MHELSAYLVIIRFEELSRFVFTLTLVRGGAGVISVMTQSVSDEHTNVLARFNFRKNCSLIPIIRLTSFSDWL